LPVRNQESALIKNLTCQPTLKMKPIINKKIYVITWILIAILIDHNAVSQVSSNHPFITHLKIVKNKDTAHLESRNLKLVVATNAVYGNVHKAGYSGVSELYLKSENEKDLFVPLYAGLNYEHIFSGDSASYKWNPYETRGDPMKLVRLSARKVELQQPRTKNWPLKTSVSYELNGNSIDFVFSATPLQDTWKKYGYIGIFVASYIDNPKEKGINFIGRSRPGKGDTTSRWIYHLPGVHGLAANHRPAGSNWDPSLDTEGFFISLVTGFSDLEYVYPFYYGLSGDNVFIMMFENSGKGGELRFAQSPDGGGDTNPAWDFIYFRKNYKVGKKFSFRARAVYKKFESREDVIRIYEAWSGRKVIRPQYK
jgi:hypothetical protein